MVDNSEDEEHPIVITIDGKVVKFDPKLTKVGVCAEDPNDQK